MPVYLVLKRYFLCWYQNCQSLPCLTILVNEKAKFKVVIRKYLHTHFFSFTVYVNFFICKDDL